MIRFVLTLGALALVSAACGDEAQVVKPGESLIDAVASAAPGSVIHLEPGQYQGPLLLDQPGELVGTSGVVLESPADQPAILITSDHVTVRNLTIEGGRSGIKVVGAEEVFIDGVVVRDAQWHGILVDDSYVIVTGCRISGLQASLPQGFEIRNADSRPPSRVEGCRIEGPVFEGLVAHVSHVTFVNNVVDGSFERGIVITEMSNGRMQGNVVENAKGSAYLCGDMSLCSVVDKVANSVQEALPAHASGAGHGLVVHFHSQAFVEGLEVAGAAGEDVLVMLGSELVSESLYP